MRYESVYSSEYASFYRTVSEWCNQPQFYKSFTFRNFAKYSGISRKLQNKYRSNYNKYIADGYTKLSSWVAMDNIESKFVEIAEKYFDIYGWNRAISDESKEEHII